MAKVQDIDLYSLMNEEGCEWTYHADETAGSWILVWRHPSGLSLFERAKGVDFEATKILLVEALTADLANMVESLGKLENWLSRVDQEDGSSDLVPEKKPAEEPIPVLHWCIDKVFTRWSDGTITEKFAHRFIEPDEILSAQDILFSTYEEAVNHAIGIAYGRVA